MLMTMFCKKPQTDTMKKQGNEVSYGIPFRWSASRMLAADVKEALCGGGAHNDTEACGSLMRMENWELHAFMRAFTGEAPTEQLFHGVENFSGTVLGHAQSEAPVDENLLWNGPDAGWVACDKKNFTCYGTLSKDEWYGPRRGDLCVERFHEAMEQQEITETAFGINICNLDSSLAGLCQVCPCNFFAPCSVI